MAKMTKQQATQHQQANDLIGLSRELTPSEQEFVLDHWMEDPSARLDGAFFTPACLAHDLATEVDGARIIDLCAGIGALAWQCRNLLNARRNGDACELVCIEKNPEYVRVGRKVLPEATWILGDVFDVPAMKLGHFDTAIGNPPYGAIPRGGRKAPRYTGARLEYHVIDIAAEVARRGVFLIPQELAPFRFSGRPNFTEERTRAYERFEQQTKIILTNTVGIDTSGYNHQWRDATPQTEIVLADFEDRSPGAKATPSTINAPQPSKDWRRMTASDFGVQRNGPQTAPRAADHGPAGTISLFEL